MHLMSSVKCRPFCLGAGDPEDERYPDSKVPGANMGPIWGRQDPGGPHIGPMNFAVWVDFNVIFFKLQTV